MPATALRARANAARLAFWYRTDPTRQDFKLEPGKGVTGVIQGVDGKPLRGVYVAVVGMRWDAGGVVHGHQLTDWESCRTKADGSFRVTGLRDGILHQLYVRKDGFATVVYDIHRLPVDKDGVRRVRAIRLQKPQVLSGQVVDGDDKPWQGIRVQLKGTNADRATRIKAEGAAPAAAAGRGSSHLLGGS